MKINLGAGSDVRDGFKNHDIIQLPGIDVVHDLNQIPWPWQDGSIQEILMNDVIEHLDSFIQPMEEMFRILCPGGRVVIRAPHMGSWSFHADPTHKRSFVLESFLFFDPVSSYCQERHYYSHARFSVEKVSYICAPFIPYFTIPKVGSFSVSSKWVRSAVGFINQYFVKNIIQDIEVVLKKV